MRNDAEVVLKGWRLCRRCLAVVLMVVEIVLKVLGGCVEGGGSCAEARGSVVASNCAGHQRFSVRQRALPATGRTVAT